MPRRRRRRLFHIQVLVTQRCNAVCTHCDKAVGYSRLSDIEMTAELMRGYVDRMRRENFTANRVTLSGGEPVLNPELQGIIDACVDIPALAKVRILTNDLNSTRERREEIRLPDDRFGWAPAPLDNIDDPKSGKNLPGVRYRDRVHMPYWISPADYGVDAKFEWCSIRNFCGRGLDNVGWTMCGQAPIIGRVLGLDPYVEGKTITEIVDTALPEICKHCVYGIYKGEDHKHGRTAVEKFAHGLGVEVSPTYEYAFSHKPRVYSISTEKTNACSS